MNSKNNKTRKTEPSGKSTKTKVEKHSVDKNGKSISRVKNSKSGTKNPAKSLDFTPEKADSVDTFNPKRPIQKKSDIKTRGASPQYKSRDIVPDANEEWYSNVKKSNHIPRSSKSVTSSRDRLDDDNTYPRRSAYISKKETGIFETQSMSAKDNSWRLNKYIANSGICSRREADTIIAEGKVKVNGKVVTEMGIKVTKKDRVTVDGSEINPEDFIYILLNKPKNYITTTDDEKDRATVMDLIKDATGLRVYPVGRLDRNTTGLLILTNDGDLANRLMHPKYKVKKTYEVETTKPMHDDELNGLLRGITLEDGEAKAHDVERSYTDPNVIRISIFEGRNRQVRRMIEYFRHEVVKLHRTNYAGLNVKGVRQGRWRFLKSNEVKDLRMLVKLFDLKQK